MPTTKPRYGVYERDELKRLRATLDHELAKTAAGLGIEAIG
jgi:hypothetical protein